MKAQKIITIITIIVLVAILSVASFMGIYKLVDYLDEKGESLLAPVFNPDDIMGY